MFACIFILIAILCTFLFIHMNYKKYPIFSTLNEILMFKKMIFNKKMANYAGKKTTVSFFFIISCFLLYTCIFVLGDWVFGLNGSSAILIPLIEIIFIEIIIILIIRLIFEFVVIPIALNKSKANTYQQNAYMQSPPQQNYIMPQSEVSINNQSQQPIQNMTSTEPEFRFCSQCGTRYTASDGNCPNCGMQ